MVLGSKLEELVSAGAGGWVMQEEGLSEGTGYCSTQKHRVNMVAVGVCRSPGAPGKISTWGDSKNETVF